MKEMNVSSKESIEVTRSNMDIAVEHLCVELKNRINQMRETLGTKATCRQSGTNVYREFLQDVYNSMRPKIKMLTECCLKGIDYHETVRSWASESELEQGTDILAQEYIEKCDWINIHPITLAFDNETVVGEYAKGFIVELNLALASKLIAMRQELKMECLKETR